MDPTREERNDQAQEKQRQGIPGRGIATRFLGRIGRRIAVQTALRGFAALLANPITLIVIGVTVGVFIIVFVIVFAGGFGGVPGAPTLETTPTIVPTETETPTPTPAAPESAL